MHIFIYFVPKEKKKFHDQPCRWHEMLPVLGVSADGEMMSPAFVLSDTVKVNTSSSLPFSH